MGRIDGTSPEGLESKPVQPVDPFWGERRAHLVLGKECWIFERDRSGAVGCQVVRASEAIRERQSDAVQQERRENSVPDRDGGTLPQNPMLSRDSRSSVGRHEVFMKISSRWLHIDFISSSPLLCVETLASPSGQTDPTPDHEPETLPPTARFLACRHRIDHRR